MSFWDWESYVQNLRHKKSDKGGLIFLIDSLEKARYTIDVASRTLRLYFQDEADHRFAYTRLQDSDRLKALERFLEEDGYPLRFSLHQLAQGELANHPDLHDRESIQEAKERRKRAFFERLRREVEEHEVFQALAKAFPGTEIRSVTPLKASAEVSA